MSDLSSPSLVLKKKSIDTRRTYFEFVLFNLIVVGFPCCYYFSYIKHGELHDTQSKGTTSFLFDTTNQVTLTFLFFLIFGAALWMICVIEFPLADDLDFPSWLHEYKHFSQQHCCQFHFLPHFSLTSEGSAVFDFGVPFWLTLSI